MKTLLTQTAFMFLLAFAISMVVAALISLIRNIMTSVYFNSFFNEDSKRKYRRALHIHKIHEAQVQQIALDHQRQSQPELFNFYMGITDQSQESGPYYGRIRLWGKRQKTNKTGGPGKSKGE